MPDVRLFKKILYLTVSAGMLLGLIAGPAVSAVAQDRPEITPLEKVINKKKEGPEPRAVGIVQLDAKGKATLVPVAILINGRFYDASSYKAAPVPMALEYGTVYEGERSGTSLGLFTVNGALHNKDPNAPNPWIATGSWLLQGSEAPKTTRKAESVPVGIETTDAPPRLSKGKPKQDNGADTNQANTAPQSGSSPSSQTSKPADSGSQSEKKSSESKQDQSKQDQPSADQSKSSQSKSDQAKPDQTTPSNKPTSGNTKSEEAAPAPGEDTNSSASDANRPKLRRGKPNAPLPSDEDVPGYTKPGAPGAAAKSGDASNGLAADSNTKSDATGKKDQSAGGKSPQQLIPAISDTSGPDPRSFVFEWVAGDEDDRRKQVLSLAQQQLHSYVEALAKAIIPAKPTPTKAVSGPHKAVKTPDLVLEDAQMKTFDLWTNNQPVIVFTAKAHPPLPAVGAATSGSVPEYWITLVLRTDIYNNVHKLYAGVTDKFHLDVTPQLDLIDAVDADGDGRGELLFRKTTDVGNGYIIYRATADTLWKMFDSLSPE